MFHIIFSTGLYTIVFDKIFDKTRLPIRFVNIENDINTSASWVPRATCELLAVRPGTAIRLAIETAIVVTIRLGQGRQEGWNTQRSVSNINPTQRGWL